jgi:hypothetical protein
MPDHSDPLPHPITVAALQHLCATLPPDTMLVIEKPHGYSAIEQIALQPLQLHYRSIDDPDAGSHELARLTDQPDAHPSAPCLCLVLTPRGHGWANTTASGSLPSMPAQEPDAPPRRPGQWSHPAYRERT